MNGRAAHCCIPSLLLACLILLAAGACSSGDGAKDAGPNCTEGPVCGAVCCTSGQDCVDGVCKAHCTPSCSDNGSGGRKECGDNGCGGSCGSCIDGEQCSASFTCTAPVETGNDTCDKAQALVFDADTGTATAYGDNTQAARDVFLGCAQNSGQDVVYSFTLTKREKVTAVVKPMGGSSLWPALALRTVCADNAAEIVCDKAPARGESATLVKDVLPAGGYFLWVAGNIPGTQGAGPFRLTVTLSDPPMSAPPNDTCGNAETVTFTDGRATITADTSFADNDSGGEPTCAPAMTGPDVFYKIEVDEPSGLIATITSTTPSSYTPGLYLSTSCATPGGSACAKNGRIEQFYRLDRGTYYLGIDSLGSQGGVFTLELQIGKAPDNDTCAHPETLALEPDNTVTVTGDTTFAGPDAQGQGLCAVPGSHDVVYDFVVSEERTITAAVTPPGGSRFTPMVFLRASCDDPSNSSLGCAHGSSMEPASARVLRVPAGHYFVWVGGMSATSYGAFTLTVTATPIVLPTNDTCSSPEDLTLTDGKATILGATFFATDGARAATCAHAAGASDGPDLVYRLVLDQAASLTATLKRDGKLSALEPALYLRSVCTSGAAADEKACGAPDATHVAFINIPMLTAGSYFLFVDGFGGSSGEFQLDVSTAAPVTNDTCATVEEIAIDPATGSGTASGDTTRANDNASGTCQTSGSTSADVVYKVVLGADKTVSVDITPADGSSLKPAISVRTTCEDQSSELIGGCSAMHFVIGTTLYFPVLSQGTYFIWVDGQSSTGGFKLTVTANDAPPPPPGDDCTSAQPLTLTASGTDPTVLTATVTGGDLTNARDNSQGVGYCDNSRGHDLVYSFSLTEAHKLVASLTPDPFTLSYRPAVYIRSACAGKNDANQLACALADSPGLEAIATIASLPQGDYFVWVDGMSDGRFSLDLTASAPVTTTPSNENCSAPAPLVFVGNSATATGTTVDTQNDTRASASAFAGAAGGDVVYTFTTSQASTITASAAPAAGAPAAFRPVVIIRDNNCATITRELAYNAPTASGQTATAAAGNAPAGTYYVWVDTGGLAPTTAGPFTLDVTLSVPNDGCGGATALTANQTVNGSTASALDQYGATGGFSATCAASLGTQSHTAGADVVYSYAPAATGNFTVTVTPSAGFDAVVWATDTLAECGKPSACLALADQGGSGSTETLTVNGSAGHTYYIVVDAASTSGTFTIKVQ